MFDDLLTSTTYPGKTEMRRRWLLAVEDELAAALELADRAGQWPLVAWIEDVRAEAARLRVGLA